MEEWREIPGTNGEYLASSKGRIKTAKSGRILSPCVDNHGYLRVALFKADRNRRFKVHRLVASAFHGAAESSMEVNHIDGNKKNNRPENLEWVTPKENVSHAIRTGLRRNHEKFCIEHRKPVEAINIATGERTYFESIVSAKAAIRSCHIQEVLRGVRGQTKGYTFRYVNGGDAM